MANRGRPKGSTYPDEPYLDQIADALARAPEKSANSVIMAIAGDLGISDYRQQEAFRRRLHDKWRTQKEERLAEARERQAERNHPAQRAVEQNPSMLDLLRTTEGPSGMQVPRVFENRQLAIFQEVYDDLPHVRIQKMLDDMPAMRLQRMLEKLNL